MNQKIKIDESGIFSGNILGEPFKDYVSKQITTRQKIHGKTVNRSTDEIRYLNSRNAWIKLASGVSLENRRLKLLRANNNPMVEKTNPGQELAVKNVLFNGLTSFGNSSLEDSANISSTDNFKYNQQQRSGITGLNRAYGVGGNDFGYSPMPGIIDADIKDLNRGSLKQATINIKCHNRNQLDVIDVLYMRLGITVFLEWGYDKYLDNDSNLQNMGTTLIDTKFFQDEFQSSDYSKFLPEIEKKRKELNGNYDGFFGIISNFSWTFESDGSYSVKIELMSHGDISESLKVNLPSTEKTPNTYQAALQKNVAKTVTKDELTEETFYGTIFPGLKLQLDNYYDRIVQNARSNGGNRLVNVRKFSQTLTGLSFQTLNEKEGKPVNSGEGIDVDNINDKTKETEIKKLIPGGTTTLFQRILSDFFDNSSFRKRYEFNYLNVKNTEQDRANFNIGNITDNFPEDGKKIPGNGNDSYYIMLNDDVEDFLNNYGDDRTFLRLSTGGNEPILGGQAGFTNFYNMKKLNNTQPAKRPDPPFNIIGGKYRNKINNALVPEISQLQQEIVFFLFNKDNFITQFYEFAKKKGTADKYLKQNQPSSGFFNSGPSSAQTAVTSFTEIGKEQADRNIIFRYFWDIRLLFNGRTTTTIINKRFGFNIPYLGFNYDEEEENVEFEGLDKQPNFSAFDVEIGNVLNPYKIDPTKWNKGVKFPIYDSENISVDFVKLSIFPIANSYFIRLGTFLDYLQNKVIPKIDSSSDPKVPLIKINTDEKTNLCYVIDNMVSTNITKCLIKQPNFFTGGKNNKGLFVVSKGDNSIGLNDFLISDEELKYGKIMNIYFNFSRIEQILEKVDTSNSISLFTVLESICEDINESLGNINNLEPVIDKETNTFQIIDQTPIPGINKITPKLLGYESFNSLYKTQPLLEIFGYNGENSNFVRNIGLTTEINKNYATMITIGATANGSIPGIEATAFSSWNIGIHDRFKKNLIASSEEFKANPASKVPNQKKEDEKITQVKKQNEQVLINYNSFIELDLLVLGLNQEKGKGTSKNNLILNESFISKNKDVVSNYYKYAQSITSLENLQNQNSTSTAFVESSIGFLPFNLKIDMDGISGIKIYNRVKVNTKFLPSNYGNSLDFIVTGVNHKVSNNDWITSITTLATSKSVLNM